MDLKDILPEAIESKQGLNRPDPRIKDVYRVDSCSLFEILKSLKKTDARVYLRQRGIEICGDYKHTDGSGTLTEIGMLTSGANIERDPRGLYLVTFDDSRDQVLSGMTCQVNLIDVLRGYIV